jgi:predicted DNA-binding antitoxin AbrB/MazE fold protein
LGTIGTREACIKENEGKTEEGLTMRQTIKARYHHGVLQPLEPLALAEEVEVQVTVETATPVSAEDILQRAARVYQGFTAEEVGQVEAIALDRQHFFREPAA